VKCGNLSGELLAGESDIPEDNGEDREHMALRLTSRELDYLRTQRLGRLATVDSSGAPQNNPVGFSIDEATGQVIIGGRALAKSRKFRNLKANSNVAFVVDDLESVDPWTPRGIEIRGRAEALEDVDPPMPFFSREIIRITPEWIGSWGIEPGTSYTMTIRRAGSTTVRQAPGDS
jgi:pyridoxamine 5'-phosphate oxidase family protein